MGVLGFFERRAADAIVPGSGELLGVWQRMKPYLPYALGFIALLILAFLLYRAPWAENRQKAKDYAHFQPMLATALNREQIAFASLQGADAAMRVQSASIRILATAEAAKLAEAQRIIAQAHKLDAQRQSAIAALRSSASKPIAGPPCEASDTTKGLWQ